MRWFGAACVAEGGLVVVAVLLGWLLGIDPWTSWRVDGRAWLVGLLGVGPPLGLLVWVTTSAWAPVVALRAIVDRLVRSTFATWRVWQLAVLSLLAGVGEESLFRGVIQPAAEGWFGEGAALIIAGILFGLIHPITRLYAVLAGMMGIWFGWLWLWSGSLLAPMIAHALYDFIALVWCVKLSRPCSPVEPV